VLSWVKWDKSEFERNLETTFSYLTKLRAENPSLRPVNFGNFEKAEPGSDLIRWYNKDGGLMTEDDWNSSETRVIQRLSENLTEDGTQNLTLLVINGSEESVDLGLPVWETVSSYELLWDSAEEVPNLHTTAYKAGGNVAISECSVKLFRAVAR
jgi:glycogen operon protein